MIKTLSFLAIMLAVVFGSGPSMATPYNYNFDLSGVSKATKVMLYDINKDFEIVGVDSDWKKNYVYNRGVKISGNTDRLENLLNIDLQLNDEDGDGTLLYAIFKKSKLKEWGRLTLDDQIGVTQKKRNLERGVARTAKWSFGGKKALAPATATFNSDEVPPTQVPEPATMLLLGMGLIGVSFYARRRFN